MLTRLARLHRWVVIVLVVAFARCSYGSGRLQLTGGWVGQYQHSTRLLAAGNAAINAHNYKQAEAAFQTSIREQPTFWPGYYALAGLYFAEHNWSKAIEEATLTLRYDATIAEAELLRAEAYKATGNSNAFLRDINDLIRIRAPRTFADALNARAWFYATWPDDHLRNGAQAVKDAIVACKLTNWKYPNTLDTLAAAYAEAGDFDSATRYEQQALAANARRSLAREYQERVELYKRHQPHRTRE